MAASGGTDGTTERQCARLAVTEGFIWLTPTIGQKDLRPGRKLRQTAFLADGRSLQRAACLSSSKVVEGDVERRCIDPTMEAELAP